MRKAGSRAAGLAGAATLRDEGGRYVASRTLLRGCCGSCEVAAAGWGGGDAAVVEGVAAGLAGGTSLVVGSADVEGAGLRAAGPGVAARRLYLGGTGGISTPSNLSRLRL